MNTQIHITDKYLGQDGLEIGYLLNGEAQDIILDKFKSGDLLLSAGIIEGYKNHRVTIDGERMDWSDFVDAISLQEEDFVLIVRTWEARKVCNRINNAA